MATKNNDVEIRRENYEKHALEYLKFKYPNSEVNLLGHTRVGRNVRDIHINISNGIQFKIEVKGSLLIDADKKHIRWQRVKLTEKDYASFNDDPDFYLFVFDTGQVGESFSRCHICEQLYCSMNYTLIAADRVHRMIKDKTKPTARLTLLKIIKEVNI